LLFLAMGMLGMGNGAVFQLVPQRFPKEIGVITGIVGAAGGVGGFLLPTQLGGLKQWLGSFGPGFALFGLASVACLGVLWLVRSRWEREFLGEGGVVAGAAPPVVVPEMASAFAAETIAVPNPN
jgi:MFS transporter, NNP family, nitrate/nitrite transporter